MRYPLSGSKYKTLHAWFISFLPFQQSVNHFLKRIIIAQDGTGHAPLQGSAVVPQAKVDQLVRKLLPLLDDKDTDISLDNVSWLLLMIHCTLLKRCA